MKKNLITSAILFASAAALANESAKLDEVTVYSAYATPVNQDKTASSVTVLTEKDFAERNATYVSDVLKTVPGAVLGSTGGRGTTTSLFLRGAESKHTAVIIDGIKVNPQNSGYDFGGLALSNVERIEVLRGEQSALWGSDAMGGVVYITTKSGLYKDKAFNVDFDLGTGSDRTRDGSVTISGHDSGFYYALHGDSHRTRGISAFNKYNHQYTAVDGTAIKTGGNTEEDKFHRDNVSARFGFDDGKKGVEILGSHSTQTVHYDSELYGSPLTEDLSYDDQTRLRETNFKLSGYLGSDQDLFKQKASVSHVKADSDTNGSYSTAFDSKRLNANYQLDVNFDREGYVTQAVSVLADYQRSTYDSTNFAISNYDPVTYAVLSKNYLGEKRLSEKSLATEYRLFTEDDHSISLSGRFTDNSQYKNTFTGRLAGSYRLSPNFKAHASLGSAIHNPTIIEFYGYDSRYVGNPDLKPERSRGGDLGLLIESADKQHSFDTTYFARNVDNFMSSERLGSITRMKNNEGSTQIKGVELAYTGKLTQDLTAFANYTFTRVKDSKGAELTRRPKHVANAGVNYQITEKFGSTANISYVGKRLDNYYDASYNSHPVKTPSYTLVNLGVNYQLAKNLNVYANLNNVFDKKYENVLGYGQKGRNVYVGLKGSF